ncbi:glycosyltransferase involved in cell wall biosynthesis [Mucilaginibacter sp. UYNi724]
MLNILYVFGGEKASGAEKVIERLINHNLEVVKPHLFVAPGSYADELVSRNGDIKITIVNPLKKLNRSSSAKFTFFWQAITNNLKVAAQVIKYINRNQIDIVHANTIVPAFYLIPAVTYFKVFNKKVKFIWSDHDLKYFSAFENKLAQLAFKIFDRTLVVSDAVKAKYPSSKKVLTLYNGINLSEFTPNETSKSLFRTKHGFTEHQIVIGLAGTIEPRKGQLPLIKIFENLNNTSPDARLVLAGPPSADHQQYVDEVLNAVNSDLHVTYLGKISDMPEMYNGCDILINNSNLTGSEPLGTTIYEAMAIKKIVIASNTGGSPEIITDNTDGYLFEYNDQNALLKKLEYVIGNFSSLNHVREHAREKVFRKFNIDTMTDQYNSILSSF